MRNTENITSTSDLYDNIASVIATITFFVCWIAAIAQFGFILGLGLGWIPSYFIALIAYYLTPVILLFGILFVIFLFWALVKA